MRLRTSMIAPTVITFLLSINLIIKQNLHPKPNRISIRFLNETAPNPSRKVLLMRDLHVAESPEIL
jgi:hypothetical protein